jgi:hypothetical protein
MAAGKVRPPIVGVLPLALSSYRIVGGEVDEVTWTAEDEIIRAKRWGRTEQQALDVRTSLRLAARLGMVVARRNPEHGYWEYGPQWRHKAFHDVLDAAQAAHRLGGGRT